MTAGADRNVAVLCLDTVREDYFRANAKLLRERADVVYTQCRAASSWSVPSHASMLTGELPHEHGVHTYRRDFSALERRDTFLGDLDGHRTVGASANVWAGPAFGFDDLFEEFRAVSPDRRFADGIDVGQFGQETEATGLGKQLAFLRAAAAHEHPLASLGNGVAVQLDDWLARAPVPKPFDDGARTICREARRGVAAGAEPFVLFANLMDAHGPLHHVRGYDRTLSDAPLSWTSGDLDWEAVCERLRDGDPAAERQVERYRGLYAAAIDYLDRVVAAFVDRLQRESDRPTTVIVTSDHGDHLADDDGAEWGHTDSSLAEALLHVPLVVIGPRDGPALAAADGSAVPATVDDPVSHLALRELVVGLANGTLPDVTGRPVLAERAGHSGRLADVDDRRGTAADRTLRAAYLEGHKLLWDQHGEETLFAIDHERPNRETAVDRDGPSAASIPPSGALDAEQFALPIAEFAAQAFEAAAGERAAGGVDDATRERLEELGYV